MAESELQRELKNQIEVQVEEEKLQSVLEIIKSEILNCVERRKDVVNYIKDYREKAIEEYKDDEDKVTEYFDHERFIKEEAFKSIDKRLKELTILQNSPYFGRVDFRDKEYDEIEDIYVGRFGVNKEGYEPIVVDWRAPVSSLFYNAGIGEASYKAPMGPIPVDILLKRQYIIKKQELKGMFDSAIDVKDDILQMVLSQNTGEKLKDIIMTIQKEQDDIIRQPKEKTVVVDGVAGSGKTTIALHRVAYLLYNYRESLQDKVLILGPNSIFMEYISTVLPSLGESGVKQLTFREFALNILGINNVMEFKEYMEKVLSGDKKFIQQVLYKNSSKFIENLDNMIEQMEFNSYELKSVEYRDQVVVSKEEIDNMLHNYYRDMPLYRRVNKIKRIIFSKLKDKRDEEARRIEKEYKEELSKLNKENKSEKVINLDFTRKIKIREVIEELIKVKKSLVWLENKDCIEIYNDINENKAYTIDDMAPILYLKIKLEGLKVKEEIKHVVIDEAQDYSELQLRVIKELTRSKSFTIVGDSNQRIIPYKERPALNRVEEIFSDITVEKYRLNKSYRSTREIMSYANSYLNNDEIIPLVRQGEEVVERKIKNDKELLSRVEETLNTMLGKGLESVAIICRDLEQTKYVGSVLKQVVHVKVLDKEELFYTGGVVVIPSYFAKGMEFDGVIIIDKNIPEDENKLKYVMATRALHELSVFKN